jgi:MFS family permease
MIIGFLMNAGMMGAMIYLPFFVQGVEGVSPTNSGFINMPMSLMMIVLSTLAGRWISKSGKYKRYAMIGMPFMVAAMIMMAFMNSIVMAVASMVVFGIGLGLDMPVFTLTVQNAVVPQMLGVATATNTLFRNLGGTIGIAVMGTVMNTTLTHKLESAVASGQGPDLSKLDPEAGKQLTAFMNPQLLLDQPKLKELHTSLPEQIRPLFNQLIEMVRGALSDSLTVVFLSGTALLVIAAVLVLFLKEIPLRSSESKTVAAVEEAGAGSKLRKKTAPAGR